MSDAPALHIVTGKGGTGKTTLAAALAISLARQGSRVLLAETEGRQSLAPLLAMDSIPYADSAVPDLLSEQWQGTLHVQSIEPGPALIDYVTMFYSFPGAGAFLQRSGATAFVTAIAPGLRDVLVTGKVAEAARRPAKARKEWAAHARPDGGYAYDAVVVDGPPTGRIHKFLDVTEAVASVATVGKVNEHARRIRDVIKHPRTVVHVAALPEELPVTETIEAVAHLRRLGIGIGAILVNRAPQAPGALPGAHTVEDLLARHCAALGDPRTLAAAVAAQHATQAALASQSLAAVQPLRGIGTEVIDLPEIVAPSLPELTLRLSRVLDVAAVAATL